MYLTPRPSEFDMMLLFKRGMKSNVRDRIEQLPDDLVPSSWAGYTAYASKQELELNSNKTSNNRRQKVSRGSNRGDRPSYHTKSESKKDEDGDTEMTMNAMRTELNALRNDAFKTEQDKWYSDCRAREACYRCGKKDHQASTCTAEQHKWKHGESSRGRGGRSRGRGGSGKGRGY